jgi:hypothetical protein
MYHPWASSTFVYLDISPKEDILVSPRRTACQQHAYYRDQETSPTIVIEASDLDSSA